MPKNKWLIVSYEKEPVENRECLDAVGASIIEHVVNFRSFSEKKDPFEPVIVFKWEDIETLIAKWRYYKDECHQSDAQIIEENMLDSIRSIYNRSGEQFKGLSVLLNRDLFIKYKAEELFEFIIKYDYFRANRSTVHFACCFGDTPNGMATDVATDEVCSLDRKDCRTDEHWSCSFCPTNAIQTCKHTCYWRLIGLMLGAYPEQHQSINGTYDHCIREQLPVTYIYQ